MDDEGQPLPAGRGGEVCIQGPNVIRGYENNPEATRQGVLRRVVPHRRPGHARRRRLPAAHGRLKELINRGGEKISPREIDEVLLAHPAVAEAVASACRIPPGARRWRPRWCCARAKPAGEADLLAFCRERLADFKCPQEDLTSSTAMPRTATGKIQRRNVAKALAST